MKALRRPCLLVCALALWSLAVPPRASAATASSRASSEEIGTSAAARPDPASNQAGVALAASPPPLDLDNPPPDLPKYYDRELWSNKLHYDPSPHVTPARAAGPSREQALAAREVLGREVTRASAAEAKRLARSATPRGGEAADAALARLSRRGDLALRPSSFECWGSMYEHRVCEYRDVILWQGLLFYISPEPLRVSLPPVQLTYVDQDPFRYSHNSTDRIRVLTAQAFQAQLAVDEGLDWGSVPLSVVPEAVLFAVAYHDNYGHLLGELGPLLHNTLCTYMGHCTMNDTRSRDVQVLLWNQDPDVLHVMPQAARTELWPCLARGPLARMDDERLDHSALLLRRVVAGVGPTCRGFPWCRPEHRRFPPRGEVVRLWKKRMHQCLGLDPDPVARRESPRVLFVTRPLGHGRGFVHLDWIVAKLRRDFPSVQFSVETLAGESLASQARKYTQADVLVQMHGAALGNVFFLPRGAVYVDVVPEQNGDKHMWAHFMLKDYEALGIVPIAIPPQRVALMEFAINKTMRGHLNTLDDEQLRQLFDLHSCPRQSTVRWDVYTICVIEWFMKRSNCYLNYVHIKTALNRAVRHLSIWHHKQEPAYGVSFLDLTDMRRDRDMLDLI